MANREVMPIDRNPNPTEKGKKGRKEKSPYALTAKELIKKVSKLDIKTSLSQTQMEEAVYIFCRVLSDILENPTTPEKITISLPNLGKFMFKKRKGLKKGDKYKRPKDFGIREEGTPVEMETVIVEEDMGDYLKPWFEFSPTLQTKIKDASRERYLGENK